VEPLMVNRVNVELIAAHCSLVKWSVGLECVGFITWREQSHRRE
jgi:hypothetical protein